MEPVHPVMLQPIIDGGAADTGNFHGGINRQEIRLVLASLTKESSHRALPGLHAFTAEEVAALGDTGILEQLLVSVLKDFKLFH